MSEINKDSVNYLTKTGNTYTLNQDIVLSDNSYFNLNNETFDGGGHTIKIEEVTDFSGLFHGATVSDGTGGTYYDLSGSIIKNLGVLSTTSTLSNYGGWIVREKNTSFIVEKCYSTGTIGGIDSGGICGYACTYNAIVKDCYSTGEISARYAGGICGGTYGNNAKGIFAGTNGAYIFQNSTSRVENCFSMGTISGSWAGGICGRGLGLDSNRNSSNNVVIVNNCYSTGDINGSNAGGITGTQSAQRYGIVLYSNCYSTGSFGSSSVTNAGSIFSLSNVSQASGENYFYNCYSTNTPTVGTNLTLYTENTYTVVDGVLTKSNTGTTTDIYYVSGIPDTFTDNLSSIQGSSGVSLLNGNQTSTVWTTGTPYPIHTYSAMLFLKNTYSLFPPPAVATLSQDTYYHTFYQVSQSNPKVMTSYTYDNAKTLIETVDISFGDYTISEVLQIMDNHPYVIGSNDRGTKFPMSIAYCDIYNESLTSQKRKGVISGVNRQVVNDP